MVSPKFILIFLIFILLIHILASVNGWYWTYRWLDIPMHFLGGFWLAGVFFWLNSKFNVIEIQSRNIGRNFWKSGFPKLLLVLGFVALIGVLWEFFEFICDFLILHGQILQRGAADTIKDLFFDLVGGLVFISIFKRIFIRQNLTK